MLVSAYQQQRIPETKSLEWELRSGRSDYAKKNEEKSKLGLTYIYFFSSTSTKTFLFNGIPSTDLDGSFQLCTFTLPKIMKIKAVPMYTDPFIIKIELHSATVFCVKCCIIIILCIKTIELNAIAYIFSYKVCHHHWYNKSTLHTDQWNGWKNGRRIIWCYFLKVYKGAYRTGSVNTVR